MYAVPFVRPVTTWLVAVGEQAWCLRLVPTYGATWYPVMPEPLFAGAVHETVACVLPGAADAVGGADGVPTVTGDAGRGQAGAPGVHRRDLERVHRAVREPATVRVGAAVANRSSAPSYRCTVSRCSSVIGRPLSTGAVHDTVAWPFPGTAVTSVGAAGTPTTKLLRRAEYGDTPSA